MPARYGDEQSSLVIRRVVRQFVWRHAVNTAKRIFYSYYLRDFNIASIELALGVPLLGYGAWVGVTSWLEGSLRNVPATSGTVMLAALPVIVGMQLVLGFLGHDMQRVPHDVLHRRLASLPGPHGA
jgi:hypothetical protein